MRSAAPLAMLNVMTTMTDDPGAAPTTPPGPTGPAGPRRLRRSATDRVAAGVAGGLGEYFGVDPVLFRVLFAVTSFFGGAGIIAYLLAWMLIPDHFAGQAPIDRLSARLRRHRVPFWLVASVVVIIGWGLLFSWWLPGPAGVLVIAVIILAVVLARRPPNSAAPVPPVAPVAPLPPLAPTAPLDATVPFDGIAPFDATAYSSPYLPETRAWIKESRERRRRAAPVRWVTLAVLAAALGGLAIADAAGGILLPVYFWVGGSIVLAGLIAGLILRRTPWGLTPLLVPVVIGLIAFGNSPASTIEPPTQK